MKLSQFKTWKWQWVVVLFVGVLLAKSCSNKPIEQVQTTVAKAEKTLDDPGFNVVQPLSFTQPEFNVKAELTCVTPGKPDGFVWKISSLDGKNPPAAKNVYFNFQLNEGKAVSPAAWRKLNPDHPKDNLPDGDRFMITVFEMRNMVKKEYKNYVFAAADTIQEVRTLKQVTPISAESVLETSALVMNSHPCSTFKKDTVQ